jgi:2-deoxy-D-gluconate 3-dehydrogenase
MAASFRLDGRGALVTGASRGLGQAMAVALAEAGADVTGVATSALDETRSRVEAAMARLDILVNNAVIIRRADSVAFTEADWDDAIDVNLKSVFFLAHARGNLAVDARGDACVARADAPNRPMGLRAAARFGRPAAAPGCIN